MDIIFISKVNGLFHKNLKNIDGKVATQIRETLKIVIDENNPMIYIWGTAELKKKVIEIESLTQRYISLNAITKYIDQLVADDKNVIVEGTIPTSYMLYYMTACSQTQNVGWLKLVYNDVTKILKEYDHYLFTDLGFPQYIGEIDKKKRKCRFCGKTMNDGVKFASNAHAISWFIGNDNLYCNEECKDCNINFGKGIESQLERYYRPTRNILSRNSRHNNPLCTTGANFKYEGNKLTLITSDVQLYEKMNERQSVDISLIDDTPVIKADVYRALVKYVISCIPNKYLPFFVKTIQWINRELKPKRLPKIYRYEKCTPIAKPLLNVYIRKRLRKDQPYCVAHLRFLSNVYIYVVPYCQPKDVGNSMLDDPLNRFVAKFFPDYEYVVETFNNEGLSRIFTHVKIGGNK